ncbi:MAG: MotA/TolQ/ExbB proton channel family protein [Novosphingobium sp.]
MFNPSSLFDPWSALIVCGGTALATLLRCGPEACWQAVRAVLQLGRSGFDADGARSEMAVQLRDIERDGLMRARPHQFGDAALDEATGALIGSRSVPALLAAHETHRERRAAATRRSSATFAQAAELAPVFGMVGTLISLSQLPTDGLEKGAFTATIAMAVLTTLYGLLLGNLLLAPLARAIERAGAREEQERQDIIDWLAHHLERSGERSLARGADRSIERGEGRRGRVVAVDEAA